MLKAMPFSLSWVGSCCTFAEKEKKGVNSGGVEVPVNVCATRGRQDAARTRFSAHLALCLPEIPLVVFPPVVALLGISLRVKNFRSSEF